MKQRRAFDQLTLLQLNQPGLMLRAMERAALVPLVHVYIRQSTLDQVHRNHESRRRQYGLAERARQLGWGDVVVIDDDLAISGDGVKRPGFERLLVAICEGRVGAVLTIEASRLAVSRCSKQGFAEARLTRSPCRRAGRARRVFRGRLPWRPAD